jgi:hypothetical protein
MGIGKGIAPDTAAGEGLSVCHLFRADRVQVTDFSGIRLTSQNAGLQFEFHPRYGFLHQRVAVPTNDSAGPAFD